MTDGTRLSQLDPTLNPSLQHEIAASLDGVTVKLTVQQIHDLVRASVVGNASELLDTLEEISGAVNDDPNFAATILAGLAGKMSLDGSTLPTADVPMGGYSLLNVGNLVGQVAWFAMDTAPTGWLKCNGAELSRTVYTGLFAAIGTSYGSGDGSTTFNLPDLRGEFVRGWDDGRGIDAGRTLGSWQDQDVEPHDHPIQLGNALGNHSASQVRVVSDTNDGAEGLLRTVNGGTTNYNPLDVQPNNGVETRPRNVALLACIYFGG